MDDSPRRLHGARTKRRAPRHAAPTRTWLSGASLVAGGVASLTVGAVLGGIFTGVPDLLAPPAVAGPASHIGAGSRTGLTPIAMTGTRAAHVAPPWRLTGVPSSPPPSSNSSGATTPDADANAPGSSGAGGNANSPSPVTGAPAAGAAGAPGVIGDSGSAPPLGSGHPSPSSGCTGALCAALTAVSQATSAVAGANSATSGAVSNLSGVIAGVSPALPAPVGSGSAPAAPGTGTLFGLYGALAGMGSNAHS